MLELLHQQDLPLGRPLASGDVAGDLRRADDSAVGVLQRRYGEGDIDRIAVLVPAYGLVVIDVLAAPDTRQDFRFLIRAVGRNQDGDRPADRLFGGIAEQALRAAIPARDDAVE